MNIAIVYLASPFESKLSTGDSRYEMLKDSIKIQVNIYQNINI